MKAAVQGYPLLKQDPKRIEREDTSFILHQRGDGDPDARFGYRVYATILGCEEDRSAFVNLNAELDEEEEMNM